MGGSQGMIFITSCIASTLMQNDITCCRGSVACWKNILWHGNIYDCGIRHQLDIHFYSGSLAVVWGVRMCCMWRQVDVWILQNVWRCRTFNSVTLRLSRNLTEYLTLQSFQFGYTSSLTKSYRMSDAAELSVRLHFVSHEILQNVWRCIAFSSVILRLSRNEPHLFTGLVPVKRLLR